MSTGRSIRKILFIAYYFPPLGMGGTQRLAKWCKYLRRDGVQPKVVTVKPIAYYAYDESLLDDVANVEIIRTESLDPARLLFRLGRSLRAGAASYAAKRSWMSWFFVPDSRILWIPFALWQAMRLARREPLDAVVTSGPPHSSHFIGWFLKKAFGGKRSRKLIWLADFRDSWAGGEVQPEPTPLHRWLNRAMQKFILRRADVVTTISLPLIDELRAYANSSEVTPHLLSNGYDPEDFSLSPPMIRLRPASLSAIGNGARHAHQLSEMFNVVFCGSATAIANPQTLLEGFRVFIDIAQLMPGMARLRFVGNDLLGTLIKQVEENRLEPFVEITGYVRHAEAVAAMQQASLLVYIAAPGTSAVTVGGKTYEYLASRRPVLCVGEPVAGLQLLRKHLPSRYCGYYEIDGIARALLAFFREFSAGELRPAQAIPEEFSRQYQASQLLALLEKAVNETLTDRK
jgi:glycosyltransferase involved in cell wall biosynthesis